MASAPDAPTPRQLRKGTRRQTRARRPHTLPTTQSSPNSLSASFPLPRGMAMRGWEVVDGSNKNGTVNFIGGDSGPSSGNPSLRHAAERLRCSEDVLESEKPQLCNERNPRARHCLPYLRDSISLLKTCRTFFRPLGDRAGRMTKTRRGRARTDGRAADADDETAHSAKKFAVSNLLPLSPTSSLSLALVRPPHSPSVQRRARGDGRVT